MSKRVSRSIVALLLIAAQVSMAVIPVGKVFAVADTCTWTGATDANWATGTNWSGCDNGGVPENGDNIVFPVAASNKVTNNDLVSLEVVGITVQGTGYAIGGNALTITSPNALSSTDSLTIDADMTFDTASNIFINPSSGATITFNGTVAFSTTNPFSTYVDSGTADFTDAITGNAGSRFIATNGGKIIARGVGNTYAVDNVGAESNAAFECRSTTCFGNVANKIYMGGGTVDLYTSATYSNGLETSTSTPNDSILRGHSNVTITGAGTVNDALTIAVPALNTSLQLTGAMTNNGGVIVQGTNETSQVKLDGAISGAGNLAFESGAGSFGTANTFTGRIDVMGGAQLTVVNQSSLGTNASGTYIADGGALVFADPLAAAFTEPFWIEGQGTATVPGALYNDSVGSPTLNGTITLTGDATVANSGVSDINLDGLIAGTGDLTLVTPADGYNDPGISVAGASPNTFSGTTYINGGAVWLGKTGAVPHDLTLHTIGGAANRIATYVNGDDVIADDAMVTLETVDDDISFGNNVTPEVIGGLQGAAGQISFGTSGTNLIIDQAGNTEYAGDFYSDGNTATVTKRGGGTLTLSGVDIFLSDKISYVVEGGALAVNGALRTTTGGNATVNGGTLKGIGTLGAVTVNSGVLAPGNSPGTINVTDLTLASAGTHQVEIASDSLYDKVKATGTVTLAGTLQVLPTYTPAVGTQFIIIEAGVVTGTFNGLADGATFTANGLQFRIDYVGNGVTLTYLGGVLAPNTGLVRTLSTTVALLSTIVGSGASIAAFMIIRRRRANGKN